MVVIKHALGADSYCLLEAKLRVRHGARRQEVRQVMGQALDRGVARARGSRKGGGDVVLGRAHVHHASGLVGAVVARHALVLRGRPRGRHGGHGDRARRVVPHPAHHVGVAVPVGQVLRLEVGRRLGGGSCRRLHRLVMVVQEVVRVVLRGGGHRVRVSRVDGRRRCGRRGRVVVGQRRRDRGAEAAHGLERGRVVVLLMQRRRVRGDGAGPDGVVVGARVGDGVLVVAVVGEDRVLSVDLLSTKLNVRFCLHSKGFNSISHLHVLPKAGWVCV